MEETSLDYTLLNKSRDDTMSDCKSAQFVSNESRISMKRSTCYVILITVSILLIGSEILVYLISNKNNTCQCVIPDGCFLNAKRNSSQYFSPGANAPFINKQTTLQFSTSEQTTISAFTSDKQTTEKSAKDESSSRIVTSSHSHQTTTGKQNCEENWISYGQSCYFFSNQSVGWLEAMIRCQKLDAYLVEITSADENQFLKTHAENLNKLYKKDCYRTSPYWYKGRKNTTSDGLVCQRWDSQTPHRHSRNKAYRFPDSSMADAANYCRDPDSTEPLTWCYTTDPKIRWRYCDIYQCPGGNYWTGMVASEGNWTWINTQTEVGQGYSNWGQDQPPLANSCGTFVGAIDFKWHNQSCVLPAMYICEK